MNQRGVWEGWNTVCGVFRHFLFSCSATRLFHLTHVQNVHATVALAAHQSGVFNATFLLNMSDKMQQSGRIKAVCCWFESVQCVGAFSFSYK